MREEAASSPHTAELIELCAFHHRLVHEGGWTVTLVARHGGRITNGSITSKWYGDRLDLGLILPALSLTLEQAGRYTPIRTCAKDATLDV